MQQGMLFNSLYAQQSGVDIEQIVCLVDIDVLVWKQAWDKIVERHPVLRTSFNWENSCEPLQCVHQQVTIPLEQQDWCGLSEQEQSQKLDLFLERDRTKGFHLNIPPLMRLALFRVSESAYQFIWTFHHAILDGRSLTAILKEVLIIYDAILQGKDIQLPQPRPYRDHIKWLQQQDWSKSESYFRQLLKGFIAPTPLLVNSIEERSGFGEQEIRLSQKATSMLQALAQQHQLTLNTLVQAAWAILLSRYSGESDIVFGAARACRYSSVAGAESMVGMLINTLPVRVNVPAEKSLLPWLQELRSQWVALREYEHTPLVNIQSWSEIASGTPLFDSILMFENNELNSALQLEGDRWKNLQVKLEEQTNFPLTLMGYAESELLLKLKYSRCLFDDAKITRMLGHLQTLLSIMACEPWQCLGELPLLTASERSSMLIEWNHTETDFQKQCIHQLFEAQVERTPDAVAVVFDNEQLTYGELNSKANQLAHHLRQLGVKPGVLVAVYLERSLEMIPAVLGILKAGGAYVPLEPSFPQARIQLLLSSLEINCLVTQTHLLASIARMESQLPALQNLICLDTQLTDISEPCGDKRVWYYTNLKLLQSENLPILGTSDDIAYVIFTSGSTGTPKGVVVRHEPVINLIEWVNKTFNINSADRVLFITSLCFDLSVYDIFGLLAAGGSIRVVSNHDVRDPEALLNIVCNEPITFWDSAPPALQQLSSLFPTVTSNNSSLRLVFMSGDWIPVTLPDQLKTTFPGVEVISLGGATEATVWSNYYPIGKVESDWVSIPYGKPIQNAKYYILDSYLNPCPIGVSGELHIGGECLASGYLNQSELTAQKFIPNPFIATQRLYKTGDLARYLPDGNIEFLGRIDHQVKIRGFRIELGEIESVLAQHEFVQETVVIAREDEPGNKRLVAYVVLQDSANPINELRRFLQEKLPEYMVPAAFVAIEYIPLTPNGKVDRRALPIPDQTRLDLEKAFVAANNAIELQLTEIWEKVLGVVPIGITDNFFDLGGHSLLAVKLFTQVEKRFGKKLPLATLFKAPTIKQLADIIELQENASWSSLVVIQPGSSNKKPIFFIHALGGNIIGYQTLVRYLGSDQPIYGLQARGLDGKSPHTKVEDMAADYIQEIRTLQPNGSYQLAGFSSGGIVAFEMAQQLVERGDRVDLLAMFDTYSPKLYIENPTRSRTFFVCLRSLLQLPLQNKWNYILAKVDWFKSVLSGKPSSKFDLWSEGFSEDANPHNMVLIEALKRATMANYLPKPYSGKITLFTTKEVLRWCQYRPHRGWDEVVQQGVEIHEVPGTHLGMLGEPNVQVLAQKMKDCLNVTTGHETVPEYGTLLTFPANTQNYETA